MAYVVAWEKAHRLTLNLALQRGGACTSPDGRPRPLGRCAPARSATPAAGTFTDPGAAPRPAAHPNDQGFVNALLANQGELQLDQPHLVATSTSDCPLWQSQPPTTAVAQLSPEAHFAAGTYGYEITAATSYGESEPLDAPGVVSVGSRRLGDPQAGPTPRTGRRNGGNAGPDPRSGSRPATSAAPASGATTSTAQDPGSSTFGLIGQVPEKTSRFSYLSYSFTDTGSSTPPGAAPGASDGFPTATNPGIDCSSTPDWGAGCRSPAPTPDASISPGDRPRSGVRTRQRPSRTRAPRRW